MIPTTKLSDAIQLAEASYTLLGEVPPGGDAQLAAALANANLNGGFSATQAQTLAASWTIVHHQANTASGFSASLFRAKDDPSSLVLALRGTEFRDPSQALDDLGKADIGGIILSGLAVNQILDLYNYWKRLTSPLGLPVRHAKLVRSVTPPSSGLFYTQPRIGGQGAADYYSIQFEMRGGAGETGLELVVGAPTSLVVAGHSLGGHLSTAFLRFFGNSGAEAVTVNGMGSREDPFVNAFFDALAETPNTSFDAQRISNVFGSAGPNLATGELLYPQQGIRAQLFTEAASFFGASAVLGHGGEQMTDTAAVYDLFVRIDDELKAKSPSEMAAFLLDIFKAASPTSNFVLESVVNMLGKLFVPGYSDILPTLQNDREALYQRIVAARNAIPQGGLRVERLVGMDASTLAGRAQSDIAYRYALWQLNPFAVTGASYSRFEADLALYDAATDQGTITEKWLEARGEVLGAKIMHNRGDVAFARVDDKITDTQFGNVLQRTLAFGKDGIDSLSGGIVGDALFGGAGGDTISGGLGNDYIEGNDGFDTIDGGWGDDEVYGGLGIDTINGSLGADRLYGGMDGDAIDGGSGEDVIYGDKKDDENSTQITGDDTIDGGSGSDRIWGGGGKDTIRGGGDNDQIEGNAGDDKLYGDAGADIIKGGLGENLIVGGADADRLEGGDEKDTIYGDEESANGTQIGSADNIDGGKGDDFLYGGGGADTILGGEGKDEIVGGHGSDVALFGGAGDDTIYGGRKEKDDKLDQGLDRLYGEAGKDELFGGNGIDFLFGGADEDKLHGEGGNDRLEGGTGFDTYYYTPNDSRDIIKDEGNEGQILWGKDEIALFGGTNSGPGDRVYYDNPDDWRFRYEASRNPNEGRFDVIITSRQGGLLEVRDLLLTEGNGLGLRFNDGKDEPDDLPPAPPIGGVVPPRRGDPLVLDLDGLGIGTLGLNAQLHFDHDGNGFAERTGWVGAGDGVLVLDKDASGSLSDGQELFGDFTRLAGGQLAANGFQALSAWDANRDGRIDSLDPVWSSLSVGSFDVDEETGGALLADPTTGLTLTSLDALGIASLNLASSIVNATDLRGNTRTRTSSFTLADGTNLELAEYRFARDMTITRPVDAPVISDATRALPGLIGGAQVLTLREALEQDASVEGYLGKPSGYLRGKLDAFTSEPDAGSYYARFEDLFNAWTGLEAIPAAQMRGELSARQVVALEKFYGLALDANPHHFQSLAWEKSYRDLTERFYGELLNQTHFRSQYEAMTLVPRAGATPYG
ncbi:MAG: calcium-binding protein, partial [Burkholderiales bacterium]